MQLNKTKTKQINSIRTHNVAIVPAVTLGGRWQNAAAELFNSYRWKKLLTSATTSATASDLPSMTARRKREGRMLSTYTFRGSPTYFTNSQYKNTSKYQ